MFKPVTGLKKGIQPVILLLFGLAIGLGLAELGAWLYDDARPWHVDLRPKQELKVFKYMPNTRIRWTLNPDHPGINSLGVRDEEFTPLPGPGEFRIAVVGDSIPFGVGVGMEESYPQVLERKLKAQGIADVQVINAGVPGYTGTQVAAFLKSHVLLWRPSKIIISLAVNDLDSLPVVIEKDGNLYWEFYADRQGPDFSRPIFPFGTRGHIWLWRHSHLYRLLSRAIFSLQAGDDVGFGVELSARRNIAALKDAFFTCRKMKIDAFGVLVPLLQDAPDPMWGPRAERLVKSLKEAGLNIMEIRKDLLSKAGSLESLRVSPKDRFHLNKKGNELVAEILVQRMKHLGWIRENDAGSYHLAQPDN
ncbi:MAG: hypothetical protein GXP49_10785 [Deltaproteobacteria bacterium]|nr:hypothetical protein [Deltaproteobacteria bacterium]